MNSWVTCVGFGGIVKKLGLDDNKVDAVIKKHAFNIVRNAKRYCPVKSGNLAASIKTKKQSLGVWVIRAAAMNAGAATEYALVVECMGSLESPKAGILKGQMPYLRPALYQEIPLVEIDLANINNIMNI